MSRPEVTQLESEFCEFSASKQPCCRDFSCTWCLTLFQDPQLSLTANFCQGLWINVCSLNLLSWPKDCLSQLSFLTLHPDKTAFLVPSWNQQCYHLHRRNCEDVNELHPLIYMLMQVVLSSVYHTICYHIKEAFCFCLRQVFGLECELLSENIIAYTMQEKRLMDLSNSLFSPYVC